jgi:hypothetical protein
MEALVEAIRAGVQSDASSEQKHQAVLACGTIVAALSEGAGEPLARPTQSPASPAAVASPPVAMVMNAIRGMSPDQLLEVAIARLRSALPADASSPAVQPVKFHLLPLDALRDRGKNGGGP